MHTKPKTKAQTQTKKTFQWGISSTTIDFMRSHEVEAVRDGSTTDCGCITQVPVPKRKAPSSAPSKE